MTLLHYQELIDLDLSELDTIMDNLAAENINELARKIQELGNNFTTNVETCQQHILAMLNGAPLNGKLVSKIIAVLISDTGGGGGGGNNYDMFASGNQKSTFGNVSTLIPYDGPIFVTAIKALVPNLDWKEVFYHLDCPHFLVRSRQALQLLTIILERGIQPQPFPIQFIYKVWGTNKHGQISWLSQIIQNPDVFNLCGYPHASVNVGCCKVPPDETNKHLAIWKCLDLLDILFRLAECPTVTTDVFNMIKTPMTTYPDILTLGVVQINMPLGQFRQYILKQLVNHLLLAHSNASSVLSFMWNYENNKPILHQIILTTIAAYYGQNPDDHTRLSRVLEIAHELKPNGLTELFNSNQYGFAIDLACLAARRDFLKLDKFIEDKLNEHGEQFAQHLCQFLKRRCPGVVQNNPLSGETFQILYSALQSRANLSPIISNELAQLMQQMRKVPNPNVVGAPTRPYSLQPQQIGPSAFGSIGTSSPFVPQGKIVDSRLSGGGLRTPTAFTAAHPSSMNSGMGGGTVSAGGPIGTNPYSLQSQRDTTNIMSTGLRTTPGPIPGTSTLDYRSLGQNIPGAGGIYGRSAAAMRHGQQMLSDDQSPGTSDIQNESNQYFQKVFAPVNNMSTSAFINSLKKFRNSDVLRDKQLLECIVKNLFEEYRFFIQYPERELKIMAEIYGNIIQEGIVNEAELVNAFRKVIESLQSDPSQPLWMFGVTVLKTCRAFLHKYPKMCHMIYQTNNYSKLPPFLKDYVTAGVSGTLPTGHSTTEAPEYSPWSHAGSSVAASTGFGPIGGGISHSSVQSTTPTGIHFPSIKFPAPKGTNGASIMMTNVDILVNATERDGDKINPPNETLIEKVAFVFNNLCAINVNEKAEEISTIVRNSDDNFLRWFAQYLVMKRIPVEQNYHTVYNDFLKSVDNEDLNSYIKRETYRNISILMRSDKRQAASNFSDRQLLKSLGHWLGLITIARDQPILSVDMDLKSLLRDSFYGGQQELLYVVPFIAKCLSAASISKRFSPKSVWIYCLIKVLVEIHNEPDLKLNLKFEIEVLCRELSIDLRAVQPTGYLKDDSNLPKLVMKEDTGGLKGPSPTPQVKAALIHSAAVAAANKVAYSRESPLLQAACTAAGGKNSPLLIDPTLLKQSPASSQPPPVVPTANYNEINIHSLTAFLQQIVIPQHVILFQMHPQLKDACTTAIGHAVKEIIGGVVERSINVAITVTEHICRKDFSMDPDEQHLRRAAQQTMRSLTAGLASVTCREPLTSSMMSYIKQVLKAHLNGTQTSSAGNNNNQQTKLIDEAALAVTEANITHATNFVVKTACEKAVSELEKRLEEDYHVRRVPRQDAQPFQLDPFIMEMDTKVPESIRFKAGPVSDQMLRIYDDFSSKICGFNPLPPNDRFLEFARNRPPISSNHQVQQPIKTPSGFAPFIPPTSTTAAAAGFQSQLPGQGQQRLISGFPGVPQQQHPATPFGLPGPGIVGQERGPGGIMPSGVIEDHVLLRTGGLQQQALPISSSAGGGGVGQRKAPVTDQNLQEKVETILREWIKICYTPSAQREPQQALAVTVQMMHENGILATDEMITKFFKVCADICFDVSYRLMKNDSAGNSIILRQQSYFTLDAFSRLTSLMVKYSDGSNHSTKLNLLKKVLNILTTACQKDHESRGSDFNGMPFHRILIIMFNELTISDPTLERISWNILETFGQSLFLLQPLRVPGFVFHWLDIVGHRNFIGRLLADNGADPRSGAMYTQLIICHLKFMAPYLRNVQLAKSMSYIYRGTLRILLIILHDFPEILCDYHYALCDAIPPNCIQLRNLVLSAYPRDMRLPDPFTQSMEMIEKLPDMSQSPNPNHRDMTTIIPDEFRDRLDDYLKLRCSVRFLSDLPGLLLETKQPNSPACSAAASGSPISKYNIAVMNALVMYVGTRAIGSIHDKGQRISIDTVAHTAYMDIFQSLAVSLCTEGRYLLFNAIANQLRYPNSHTHYFGCTLLYLFLEANSEIIQEQITRILFERLVALRPHPWGLLITFIELIRNPRYDFWRHEFVRCAPEIERLFLSVRASVRPTL